MASPSFANSSESESKTPSVLIIYTTLAPPFVFFLSVGFVDGLS